MDKKVVELVNGVEALRDGVVPDDVAKHLDEVFNTCEVKVWREDNTIELPTYGKDGDACCDIYAKEIEYDEKKDRYIVHTGLHFALPENYEMELRPRSSNTKTEYYIPNAPGTLDSGYRGELLVIFKSRTDSNIIDCIDYIVNAVAHFCKNNTQEFSELQTAYDLLHEVKSANRFPYQKGDRVCQLLVRKREIIKWNEVISPDDLGETDRGEGGFGSTGK